MYSLQAYANACLKVIAAEGEEKSSHAFKVAADVISKSPAALKLRYLQVFISNYWSFNILSIICLKTLNAISA